MSPVEGIRLIGHGVLIKRDISRTDGRAGSARRVVAITVPAMKSSLALTWAASVAIVTNTDGADRAQAAAAKRSRLAATRKSFRLRSLAICSSSGCEIIMVLLDAIALFVIA